MRLCILVVSFALSFVSYVMADSSYPDRSGLFIDIDRNSSDSVLKKDDVAKDYNKKKPVPSTTGGSDVKATLNFNHADLEAVIKAVGYFVKKDFLVDQRVHGSINLISNGQVSRSQAYDILLASLRMQGFVIVEGDKFVKVLPRADAFGETVVADSLDKVPDDQIVTKVVDLQSASSSQVLRAIRPVFSPRGILTAYPDTNTLIFSDYKNNIVQAMKIIDKLDSHGSNFDRVFLKNYTAYDMSVLVAPLVDPKTLGLTEDPGKRVYVLPDRDNNSLIIYGGTRDYRKRIVDIIGSIDDRVDQSSDYHIIYLKYADANYIADTLRSVFSRSQDKNSKTSSISNANTLSSNGHTPESYRSTGIQQNQHSGFSHGSLSAFSSSSMDSDSLPPVNNGPKSVEPVMFSGATIAPDESINALVVYAPHEIYVAIRKLIDQLDIRRAQLFIESLIVEISSDHEGDAGFQFSNLSSKGPFFVTNFSNIGSSIIQSSNSVANLGTGLIVGLLRGSISLPGGQKILDLAMLAKFLETQTHTNILSKPNLLTLDNQEAKIVVGQNVPFVTGQYVPQSGSSQQPFQTIERQDVGLTLNIRPQIMKDGLVKLDIYQEVSSVQPKSFTDGTSSAADIVTSKRSISSTVMVDDGQIVALGGLIEDKLRDSYQKVPFLSNIPIIGNLFRSSNRSHQKTNLVIFLRPVIIRNNQDVDSYTMERYRYLKVIEDKEKLPSVFGIPNMEFTLLPDIAKDNLPADHGKDNVCSSDERYLLSNLWKSYGNCNL